MLDFLISPEANFEIKKLKNYCKKRRLCTFCLQNLVMTSLRLKNVQKKILISSHLELRKIFFQLKGARRLFPWQRPRRRHPRELNELLILQKKRLTELLFPSMFIGVKRLTEKIIGLGSFFR